MPTYHYCCESCQETFAHTKRMHEAVPSTCPQCGHEGLKQVIMQGNFHLKGQGWYVDGYDQPVTEEGVAS